MWSYFCKKHFNLIFSFFTNITKTPLSKNKIKLNTNLDASGIDKIMMTDFNVTTGYHGSGSSFTNVMLGAGLLHCINSSFICWFDYVHCLFVYTAVNVFMQEMMPFKFFVSSFWLKTAIAQYLCRFTKDHVYICKWPDLVFNKLQWIMCHALWGQLFFGNGFASSFHIWARVQIISD